MTKTIKLPTMLLALVFTGLSLGACAHKGAVGTTVFEPRPSGTATLVRTPIEETDFIPFMDGAELYYIYGGMNAGVPTAQVARMQPGVSFPKHTHTHGYNAVVISGNYQHWEEGEPDQGPVMTAGSTFFQGGGAEHYDACLGPEPCVLYVYFPVSADANFGPAN